MTDVRVEVPTKPPTITPRLARLLLQIVSDDAKRQNDENRRDAA
jgi:hypothetical protein